MEHDSSRRGRHHQPEPAADGHHFDFFNDEDFAEDFASDITDDEDSAHPIVNLIWAQATSLDGTPGAIGYRGTMPWRVPEDMAHFVDLTVGHPIIMGRSTWESFGANPKPLPHRDNIVLSAQPDYEARGAVVADSVEEALRLAATPAIPDDGIDRSEIWVIGGGSIFRQFLDVADAAYVTVLDARVPADSFAPDMEAVSHTGQWRLESASQWAASSGQGNAALAGRVPVARYRFLTYVRTKGEQDE